MKTFDGYKKRNLTDKDYALLAGGGHKALDTLFSALSSDTTNAIKITVGGTEKSITTDTLKTSLGLGSNAYTSTAYLPLAGGTMTGSIGMGSDATRWLITTGANGANSPLRGIKMPPTASSWLGLFARPGKATDEGGLLLSEDTCVIYNSFDTGYGLAVYDTDINLSDWSENLAFGINISYQAWAKGGFVKNGSDDSYVLLGGGGHKSISSFQTTYDGRYVLKAGDTMTGPLTISTSNWGNLLVLNRVNNGENWGPSIIFKFDGTHNGALSMQSNLLYIGNNGNVRYKAWHEGNDGSGSGLDADLLDGKHASAFAVNGHTHKTLYINGITNDVTYGTYMGIIQSPDNGPESGNWHNSIKILYNNSTGYYTLLAHNFTGSHGLWHRSMRSGKLSDWYRILDSNNYNSYAPKLDGTGATGTWNINISGDADTLDGFHAEDLYGYVSSSDLNNVIRSEGIAWTSYDYATSTSVINLPTGNNAYDARGVITFWTGYPLLLSWRYHNAGSLYARTRYSGTWNAWNRIAMASEIPSVGNGTITINLAGSQIGTFTVNLSGNTTINLTDTNTWRGITDSYSGTDTTISLSQKGANTLYNALVNGYASSAGDADTVDGIHANGLFTNLSNSGNNISITIGGTNKTLTVNYASNASSAEYLNAYGIGNPNTEALKDGKVKWFAQINRATSGYAGNNYGFPASNNANGILYLGTHPGKYGHQLGFSSKGYIYHRFQNGSDFPLTANGGSWSVLLTSTNYSSTLDNRYYTETEADNRFVNVTGDTMTGTLTMNIGTGIQMKYTSKGNDPWMYAYGAPNYGIRYFEGDPDKMTLSASGNNDNTSKADLCINGNGEGTVTIRGNIIWHAGNDGSGSGLDADLLDGKHASAFAPASHNHNGSYVYTGGMVNGACAVIPTYNGETGWHRIATIDDGTGYGSWILYLCGNWSWESNTNAILHINTMHTAARITQVSGIVGFVTDVRLVPISSNNYYVDVYINYSGANTPGTVYCYFLGNGAITTRTTAEKITASVSTTAYITLVTGTRTNDNSYAAHFYENSDIRYKTIINNLAIKANQLANLPLFDFKWLDNEDLLNTGTSAQAVQELLPYIVSGTDKLTLDYGVLGTIAGITACKELVILKSEIEQLRERVAELEQKLNDYGIL